MEIFTIENLTFAYPEAGRPALDHVNLTVRAGEFVLLAGKSGSGKTTLLRHLKPQLAPHGTRSGAVLFCGQKTENLSLREASSAIGYVMQDPEQQIVTDKVWHELAFGLESLGCDPQRMRVRVAEMASFFGIESWFHRDVQTLSGGEKQLLNLASVMAMQPQVLLLDEPTGQLDPIAADGFFQMLQKINRELGTTVLLSEHRLEEVFALADRVVVLEQGRIAADDSPSAAAAILQESGSDMAAALPVPTRIFYGLGGSGMPPLTVRDGRRWLEGAAAGRAPSRLPEKTLPVEKPVFTAKDLWFRYEKEGVDIVKGASLELAPGRLFALIGANGAGKSTLLKCLCGIARPYRGKIRLGGKKLEPGSRGQIALLPQNVRDLFVKKTVREELEEMGGDWERVAADCALHEVLKMHPYDLSGGEAQRAALAKVLLTEPAVLLLDEPTKGMDRLFQAQFAALLRRLCARGTAVLMVSHDVEFSARYADTAGLLFDGEILAAAPPRQFFSGNSFYTTAANRMCREVFDGAVTAEEVIAAWNGNR